jgi:hypothetical protein
MDMRLTGPSGVALRLAAAALAAEAAGLGVAGIFSAISTAEGKSYEVVSGIALTVIAFGTAVALAAFAASVVQARPWVRTPTVMAQVFVIIAGVTLLDGHRPGWGGPALGLAAGCLAGLFTPASIRALNRPSQDAAGPEPATTPPANAGPARPKPGQPKPGQPKPGQPKPGQPKPGQPKPGQPARPRPNQAARAQPKPKPKRQPAK